MAQGLLPAEQGPLPTLVHPCPVGGPPSAAGFGGCGAADPHHELLDPGPVSWHSLAEPPGFVSFPSLSVHRPAPLLLLSPVGPLGLPSPNASSWGRQLYLATHSCPGCPLLLHRGLTALISFSWLGNMRFLTAAFAITLPLMLLLFCVTVKSHLIKVLPILSAADEERECPRNLPALSGEIAFYY